MSRSGETATPRANSGLRYRPDIDGLRAIAVLSVIAFHLGAPFAKGGFVGVDVFFVISGFLITQLLTSDIDNVRYRLLGFYARRIRRIVPALSVMLAVVSVVSAALLIPSIFLTFAKSAACAFLSLSNAYFYRTSGYFDLGADYLPLLHTWSLGVEEQFYLIFPLIFYVARRKFGMSWKAIMLTLLAISFLFAALQSHLSITALFSGAIRTQTNHNAVFYLPFARAWEFLIGSAIAVGAFPGWSRNPYLQNASSIFGFGMIALSVFWLDSSTNFLIATGIPCLGSALIISTDTNSTTLVGRVLSISPLVKTGLISYSLYLWHWPFIVFARLLWGSGQTVLSRFILLTIIFVVSWLSWRFVETPVRTQRDLFTERRLFMGAAIGAVLFVAFAFVVRNSAGAPWRFSPDALAVAESAGQPFPLDEACGDPTVAAIREGHVCTIGRADAPISFALIGDSFANALSPAVADAADRTGKRGFVLSRGGCNSLVGVDNANSGSICSDVMDAAIAKVKSTPGIEQVILISRWTAAVEGSRFGAINFSNLFIIDKQSREPSYSENRAVFARGLDRTLKALAGYKVFIVAFVPEQLTYVPQAAALRIQHGVGNFGTAREIVERRQQNTRELLAAVASQYGATVLDAMPLLCDANICRAVQDGRSLYMDDNHLSRFGALELSDLLDAAFR